MPDRRGLTGARRASLAALILVAWAGAARAQTPTEPQLVFTIYGGLSEGTSLWRLPVQPLGVVGSTAQDTVGLARQLQAGLVAGLIGTYFASPHFGWSVDIGYFGIGSEQRCDPPTTYQPDSQNRNEQACTSANGRHVGTNVVGFLAGLTYRFMPEGTLQPFVRVTAGPGLTGTASYIETNGFKIDSQCQLGCTVTILQAQNSGGVTWVVSLAGGVSVLAGQGYRLRFEARDIITSLPVATGPANPNTSPSYPATSSSIRHLPTFLFGLDIVLERRHTRRY